MNQKYTKAAIFFGIAVLLCLTLFPFWKADNLYSSVIRIHVLANSDSEEDQARKLMVRDALLEYAAENLGNYASLEEAKATLKTKIPDLEKTAQTVLQREGCNDSIFVDLDEEYYSTRHYDGFSLPAGNYLSLQVKIGEAEGKNWWCVLFPPLCLSSSVATEDALVNAGMNEYNAKTVTCDGTEYKIRFRVLDWWSSTKEKLSRIF
ncbi:MAG: stage II sporulation protein R [Clostridia bacterium]|nr:stage II sporulation protein R [Clostridia bacterium]